MWSPTGKACRTYFTPQWSDIPRPLLGHIHPRPKAVPARRSACLRRNASCRQALRYAGVAFCRRGKRKRVHQRGALFFGSDSWTVFSLFPRELIELFSPSFWWAHLGSNQGPTGYEPVALPAELWALLPFSSIIFPSLKSVNPRAPQLFQI